MDIDALPSENNYGSAMHSARAAYKKSKEMGRFLHHYSRWTAHKESSRFEQTKAQTACERLSQVVDAAIQFNGRESFDFGGKGECLVYYQS